MTNGHKIEDAPLSLLGCRLGLLLTVFLVFPLAPAAFSIDIGACTTIDSSGVYTLTSSIIDSSVPTSPPPFSPEGCINIRSSDVILDGQGNTVDGVDWPGAVGVYVYNSTTPLTNVTLRNLMVSDWGFGVYYSWNENGSIKNITATSNNVGIYLERSNNLTVENNNASNNGLYGIWVDMYGDSNIIVNNTASSNSQNGITMTFASYNNVTNNNVNSNLEDGIYIESCSDYNMFTDNNALNNNRGIVLQGGECDNDYNIFSGNNASNNNFGIYLDGANDNTFTEDIASGNSIWDFYMQSVYYMGTNNNTVRNLTINKVVSFTGYDVGIKATTALADDPFGYRNIGHYINATNNSASSWVYLNVSFDDGDISGVNESTLRMWRYNGTVWSETPAPNGVNTAENYVYTNITSFSVFAPMGNVSSLPTLNIISPLNTSYSSSYVPLIYSVDVATSWVGYSLDGEENITLSGNTTLFDLFNGQHNLVVWANDTSGNLNSTMVYFTAGDPVYINLKNASLRVNAIIENGTTDFGTFSLGALYNGSWQKITYNYPFPWSESYLTILVGNKTYTTCSSCGTAMDPYIYERVSLAPNKAYMKWILPENITIEQTFELVQNSTKMRINVTNNNSSDLEIGIRYYYDTMVGENDGSPIYVPGYGVITNETLFEGANLSFDYWKGYDTALNPSMVSMASFDTSIGATIPDRLILASYGSSSSYPWNYTIDPLAAITYDRAVITFWNPSIVGSNESREIVTFYGLGSPLITGSFGIVDIQADKGFYGQEENVNLSIDLLAAGTSQNGTIFIKIYEGPEEIYTSPNKSTGFVQAEKSTKIEFNWTTPSYVSESSYSVTAYLYNASDELVDSKTALNLFSMVDLIPPAISFVDPTPANDSATAGSSVYVNITASESLSTAILEWNGVNETMDLGWYKNKTNLSDGAYIFRAWGNDSSNNWNSTESRVVYVDSVPPSLNVSSPINATEANIFNDWLYGNVSDLTTKVDYVNISLNGIFLGGFTVNQTTGLFSAKMNYTQGVVNNITVVAADSAGNSVYQEISVIIRSNIANVTKNATADKITVVNETLNNTDSVLEIITNANLTFQINVTAFGNESGFGIDSLSNASTLGLFGENETAIGKFIEIVTSDNLNSSSGNLSSAKIKIYVKAEDLDINGDGIYNGTGDVNISSMKIYWYNSSGGTWHPLIKGADYEPIGPFVYNNGVNETILGVYLGFAFANISHFSVYGVSASVYGGGSVIIGGGATSTPIGGDHDAPQLIQKGSQKTNLINLIISDSNYIGLVRQFKYFGEEFTDAPPALRGPLSALNIHWAPLSYSEQLNLVTHPYDLTSVTGDVYEIAAEKALKKYSLGASRLILARGDLGMDSLAASTYARIRKIPILLCEPNALPIVSSDSVLRLGATSVIIAGGPDAVSTEIEKIFPTSRRIGGKDRYETAVKIAEAVMQEAPADVVVLTDGLSPDGASLLVASYYNAPIIYVRGDDVPEATEVFLKNTSFKIVITIGISDSAIDKIRNIVT